MNAARAGQLLVIDHGEYSDYSVIGFFVVLRNFEPSIEVGAYLDANSGERKPYSFSHEKFLAFLLSKGLLLEIPCGNIYLGSYGSVEEFSFTPLETRKLS